MRFGTLLHSFNIWPWTFLMSLNILSLKTCLGIFPNGQQVKNPLAMPETQETWVQSLGWEDPLEEEVATLSSILAWRIPWTEEPGGLRSVGHKESDRTEWHKKMFHGCLIFPVSSFSRSVMSDSLQPHGLQHSMFLCPSSSPGACSNSCPLSWWCHPAISSSVVPFPCLQSFPASGSFPVSQLFASGGQSIGVSASASVPPMNIQGWFPLVFRIDWLDLLEVQRALKSSFSTTVRKHPFFSSQSSLFHVI